MAGPLPGTISALFLALLLLTPQAKPPAPPAPAVPDFYPAEPGDLELARRFAPVFHRRLTPQPENHRFDFLINFDLDGDWAPSRSFWWLTSVWCLSRAGNPLPGKRGDWL